MDFVAILHEKSDHGVDQFSRRVGHMVVNASPTAAYLSYLTPLLTNLKNKNLLSFNSDLVIANISKNCHTEHDIKE